MSPRLSATLDLSRAAPKAPVLPNLTGMTRVALRQALIDADIATPEKAKMRAGLQIWG